MKLTMARMCIALSPRAKQLTGDLSVSESLGHRNEGERTAFYHPLPSAFLCLLSWFTF